MTNTHTLEATAPLEPSGAPGQDGGGVKIMAESHAVTITCPPPGPPAGAPPQVIAGEVSATRVGYKASTWIVVAFEAHPIARAILFVGFFVFFIWMLIYWLNQSL